MFGLMDLALQLLVGSILMAGTLSAMRADFEDLLTKATAQYATILQGAQNMYVQTYMEVLGTLTAGSTTPTTLTVTYGPQSAPQSFTYLMPNPLQPTVNDLISLKLLPAGFGQRSPMKQTLRATLTPTNCPGQSCTIAGMMTSTTSYHDTSGSLRSDMIADVVAQAGEDAGGVYSSNPALLMGFGNHWSVTNPVSGNPAAILAMRIGSSSTAGCSSFVCYRRDGLYPLTRALNGGGQDINDVVNIHSAGTVFASSVAATAAVSAGTTLSAGDIGWPRAACAKSGVIAGASDHSGLQLSCQSVGGVLQWMPIGGAKLWYGYYTVQTGWGVPNPNCPAGGTPGIVVTPQSMYVDPSAAINYPIGGAGPWTVYITDGSGNQIQGSAVATTYCAY